MRDKTDPRSTEDLIELAFLECQRETDEPERNDPLISLLDRGTREVLEAAIALCRSSDPARRKLGAGILGELGSPERTFPEECCDALLDRLRNDQDRGVLLETVFAFGHLRNPRCEPDLVALKNHPDEDIRHGVAFSLCGCGATTKSSVEALLELMNDPYEEARDWATTSIGGTLSIDGPEIRAALLQRVNDDDEMTRAEALHGLVRRRDARVVPYLIHEILAKRRLGDLFEDAARDYLGISKDDSIDPVTLVAMLRQDSGLCGETDHG